MSVYSIGVLGGMGPFATAEYFNRIIKETKVTKDQEHINMIILNHATVPDRTDVIMNNQPDLFLSVIADDIKLFNEWVDFAVIPCNTSHYFINEIQAMSSIRILNMVELSVDTIAKILSKKKRQQNGKVAVLATDGTIKTNIYKNELEKNGLLYYPLNDKTQNSVMDLIYRFKQDPNTDTSILNQIINQLINKKCDFIILACTELSCMKINDEYKDFIVDSLDVLVKESIDLAKKNINKEKFDNDVKSC